MSRVVLTLGLLLSTITIGCGASSPPAQATPGGGSGEPAPRDPGPPACAADTDCADGMVCDPCATSSCPACADCVAGCVAPAESPATDACGGCPEGQTCDTCTSYPGCPECAACGPPACI